MTDIILKPAEATALVEAALHGSGLQADSAHTLACGAVAAECDCLWPQGVADVFARIRQIDQKRVDVDAVPQWVAQDPPELIIDAAGGFLLPAIEQGLARAARVVHTHGHCGLQILGDAALCSGVLGHQLEPIADQGLIALGFAPTHSSQPSAGAPAALALPRADDASVVIDLSAAELACGHLLLAGEHASPLPPAWALDDAGSATRDAQIAGQAAGSQTGGRMALVVGLLAAAIDHSVDQNIGHRPAPDTGHCNDASGAEQRCSGYRFIVIDPARLGATDFQEELDSILALAFMDDPQSMPGRRRQQARDQAQAQGLSLSQAMVDALKEAAGQAGQASDAAKRA